MEIKKMQEKIDQIISSYEVSEEKSIPIVAVLQDIQEEYRYLPREAFEYLATKIEASIAQIYGVATFYENFSLEPKGKYVIKICDGTACHVRKSVPILEALRDELGLDSEKKTTDDQLFTLETVSCLGACGLAPVMTLNEKVHGGMTPEKARELIAEVREEEK